MVKIWSLFLIDLKTSIRYKLDFYTWLFQLSTMIFPALPIILFGTINGNLVHINTPVEYSGFLLLSICFWGFVEEFWSSIFALRRMMKEGLLELNMVLPIDGVHFIFGWAMKGIISTVTYSVPLLLVVFFYLVTHISIAEGVLIFVIFLCSMIANYGLCLIFVGLGLFLIESDQLISLFANIAPFICGLFLPLKNLPSIFIPLSVLFPFSWSLDLIRYLIFRTELLLPFPVEMGLLFILTIIYLFIGGKL